MRRTVYFARTAAAAGLAIMLASCSEAKREEDAVPAPASETTAQMGLVLSRAFVRLPAVADRPGGAYFTLQSLRDEPVRIAGVSVAGTGEAELHETKIEDGVSIMATAGTIVLDPRETVQFAPGGFHVMLFDVDASLVPGHTTDLTLTLENGDKISTAALIVGPADALPGTTDVKAGMDHSSMDMSGGTAH